MIKKSFDKLPVSINNAYPTNRQGRRFLSPEGKAWKEEVAWSFKRCKPSSKEFAVTIILEIADNRRRDIDNGIKLILDSLTGIVWIDDRQVSQVTVTRETGLKNKTTICINDL